MSGKSMSPHYSMVSRIFKYRSKQYWLSYTGIRVDLGFLRSMGDFPLATVVLKRLSPPLRTGLTEQSPPSLCWLPPGPSAPDDTSNIEKYLTSGHKAPLAI
ncbi:hypothetical protein Y1Q_0011647 [Alligator mississippiensis]|uniref:Uncharacterized protein n=1 Tax=Alligator mississippiensis TaxID=8496 RepID=A0A151M0L2_ALLMI|nr:hypothetical protein Y1Q_0011647 [Alligator mississippiensis]